jgi:tRNA A-37 threonylcarbamoyl transferase component Bud32
MSWGEAGPAGRRVGASGVRAGKTGADDFGSRSGCRGRAHVRKPCGDAIRSARRSARHGRCTNIEAVSVPERSPVPVLAALERESPDPVRSHLRERMKRLLSLLSSVPQSEGEAAAFFQRRLVAFLRLQTCLWAALWLANWLLNYYWFPAFEGGALFSPRSTTHLAVVFLLVGLALLYRKPRPLELLALGDVLMTLIPAAGLALMALWGDPTHILILRAALVPSPARRTILIGAVAQALLVIATALLFAPDRAPPDLAGPRAAIQVGIWGLIALTGSGTISHVIYRLRARVTEAEQFGQYVVTKKLGEGASGIVYLAHHALLRRPTAVKLLKQKALSARAAERFEREAQQLSRLSQENIVSLYDYGRTPEGLLYYAMEYIEGVDLETLVARTGPQRPERVVDLLRQAAEALAEAHHVGLVHRDVKPGNLVLCRPTWKGELLKLVDFGLAKELGFGSGKPTLTDAHSIVGTPYYMPPEAVLDPDHLGPPGDIYSLGAVGYFLLTGRPVFAASSAVEVLYQHLYTEVPPVALEDGTRCGSPALQALLMRCLAKDPQARPAATELPALLAGAEAPWTAAQCAGWWNEHDRELASPAGVETPLKLRVSLDERRSERASRPA